MKPYATYHFRGIPGTYEPDPDGVITAINKFDTYEEMKASGLIEDPRRTNCFMSGGMYFVGGHFREEKQ